MATNTSGVNLAISGLASGMDWQSLITALANAERIPENQWKTTQTKIDNRNAVFGNIKTTLSQLQTAIKALQDPTLYSSRTVQSSSNTVATAKTTGGANLGSFAIAITQLANAAQWQGSANVSQALSPDGNLANITMGTAGFATAISAGTFTINGHSVSIATTDSLQQVFDRISSATQGAVTASYNSSTDRIALSSTAPGQGIVLGSAADTSNFLRVARLYNNGTGTISSTASLGTARLSTTMSGTNLTTAISDGGNGQGEFTINGVSITYQTSTDSIQNVLDRINNSAAGVTASFDAQNDRFVLTNKVTGDVGIALQDVTGNFLAATGVVGGALTSGQDLHYTINGGAEQVSQTNSITTESSGITGLTVTALQLGSTTVTVNSDTDKIKSALQAFVTNFNAVQSYISSQMSVTTATDGTVTAGLLTGDSEANGIASSLRSLAFSFVSAVQGSGGISSLADLGIQTNGKDKTLTLKDTTSLDSALANNLNAVAAFFTDSQNGWSSPFNAYLDNTIGDKGTLTNHQTSLTSQSGAITTQIANLEKTITADIKRWTNEFQQMESVQATINQQLQYLTQQINNGTL
jgi:flagellar hook-associated protein 2